MHYRAITDLAISEGLITPGGSTPEASLNASINMEIRRREQTRRAQRFRQHGRGLSGIINVRSDGTHLFAARRVTQGWQ